MLCEKSDTLTISMYWMWLIVSGSPLGNLHLSITIHLQSNAILIYIVCIIANLVQLYLLSFRAICAQMGFLFLPALDVILIWFKNSDEFIRNLCVYHCVVPDIRG